VSGDAGGSGAAGRPGASPPDPADLPPYSRDEQLIDATARTGAAAVRVEREPHLCVVVGRGGDVATEVHADRVARDGVPLLRRRGGGCAVVLDPGNVVLALALPVPGVGGITSAFAAIGRWIADRLADCGVAGVRQEGTSDLAVGDRKLGGSCIWRTRGLLSYATTVLVRPDIDLMERYLPHPPREPEYRRGRSHRDFVTSVAALGGPDDPDVLAPTLLAAARTQLPRLTRELDCPAGPQFGVGPEHAR
jgi:lipoate-protein ligase A